MKNKILIIGFFLFSAFSAFAQVPDSVQDKGSIPLHLLRTLESDGTAAHLGQMMGIVDFGDGDSLVSFIPVYYVNDSTLVIGSDTVALKADIRDFSSDPTMGGDLSGVASNAQIVAGAVGNAELANDAVTADKIIAAGVGSSEIASNAVTNTDLNDMAANTIKGRRNIGSGNPEDLTDVQAATVIMSGILTIDGAGTGLDADLLDGVDGSEYLTWSDTLNNLATQYDLSENTTNPAGSNQQIQFNSTGLFGADSDFYYNNISDVLGVKNIEINTGFRTTKLSKQISANSSGSIVVTLPVPSIVEYIRIKGEFYRYDNSGNKNKGTFNVHALRYTSPSEIFGVSANVTGGWMPTDVMRVGIDASNNMVFVFGETTENFGNCRFEITEISSQNVYDWNSVTIQLMNDISPLTIKQTVYNIDNSVTIPLKLQRNANAGTNNLLQIFNTSGGVNTEAGIFISGRYGGSSDPSNSNGVNIIAKRDGSGEDDFLININQNEFFRIKNNGNTGIGTNSPSQKLEVSGNIKATGKIILMDGSATLPSFSFSNDNDVGIYRISSNILGFATGGVEHLRIDGAGIATFNGIIYNATGSASVPSYSFSADGNTGIFRPTADQLAFSTNGTERARFNETGNFAIGNTDPEAGLHVEATGAYQLLRSTNGSLTTRINFENEADDNDSWQIRREPGGAFQIAHSTAQPYGSESVVVSMTAEQFRTYTNSILIENIDATTASGLSVNNGRIIYVNTTNGTFTEVGFWGVVNGTWEKLD